MEILSEIPIPNITQDDILTYYIPILSILFLFWPIVVTLFIAATSASVWLFWILTSAIFGILQLLFVFYQFLMVSLDFLGLCLLKTYSTIRSFIRYYFVRIGIHNPRKRRNKNGSAIAASNNIMSGRIKKWQHLLENTKTYADYMKLSILEPQNDDEISLDGTLNSCCSKNSLFSKTFRSLLRLFGATTDASKKKKKKKNKRPCLNSLNDRILHSKSYMDLKNLITPFKLKHSKSQETITMTCETDSHCSANAQLGVTGEMLVTTTARLHEARLQAMKEHEINANSSFSASVTDSSSSLKFLLSAVVKRNHLNVDDFLLSDARQVAESGMHHLSLHSRSIIQEFMTEVEACIDYLASSCKSKEQIHEHLHFMDKMKQNTGCTALMLSGGGAQAMYHLGTIRALIEANLYNEISVVSGTSGGSIAAAMCAICPPEDLVNHVCIPTVSTDYLLTGEMAKKNIRWFPSLFEMGTYWLQKHLLVDSDEFKRCCDFYFSNTTFEEAFQKTGKHVCISVSASRSGSGGAQRLLLNHISTPHVTISSAVAASCALPGVMKPAKLEIKMKDGSLEKFEVDGTEWVDGSIQADLPFKRISTMFNVSNYIVCQVNFHIIPFLNKAHHPNTTSLYWRLFQILEWDIRSRVMNLSKLGLFPSIFGQDMSNLFKQKYHGNVTIVPRFTRMQIFGLKILSNPDVNEMKYYLQHGQIATWVYISVINHMLRFERALNVARKKLQHELFHNYDVSLSLDSSSMNIHELSYNRELLGSSSSNNSKTTNDNEKRELKEKVLQLQNEVSFLREKLQRYQSNSTSDDVISNPDSITAPVSSISSRAPQALSDTSSEESNREWTLITRTRSKRTFSGDSSTH